MVSFDSYYCDQGHLTPEDRALVNYDHPSSLDGELMVQHLNQLRAGHEAAIPVYDFATHTRSDDLRIVEPADVIVVEGILLFAFPEVLAELDLRVFRRCPEEVRFERRIYRDCRERGRTPESVWDQLRTTVKPMHDSFVEPHAADADVVTEHGEDLDGITESLTTHLLRATAAA